MQEIDVFRMIQQLKIELSSEPIKTMIGDMETCYGMRKVGTKVTAKLIFGEDSVICEDSIIIND